MSRLKILTAVLLFVSAACSSMQVKTAADPQADFSEYHTYAWAPSATTESGSTQSIMDETVQAEVDRQLEIKGLRKVSSEQADLVVSYSGKTRDKVEFGAAPGPWYWGPVEEAYVTPEGTLTLRFVDPRTNRTVWTGSATDAIGSSGASQKQVVAAVDDILKDYPKA